MLAAQTQSVQINSGSASALYLTRFDMSGSDIHHVQWLWSTAYIYSKHNHCTVYSAKSQIGMVFLWCFSYVKRLSIAPS